MMIRRLCKASVTAAATAIMLGFSASIASQATPPQEQFVGELIDKAIKVLGLPVEKRAQREAGFRALLNQNFDIQMTQFKISIQTTISSENRYD